MSIVIYALLVDALNSDSYECIDLSLLVCTLMASVLI